MARDSDSAASRWLLLIHQIPPRPAYFRAKVARRLARIGAVAIKNSVYVLPAGEQTLEDLQWVAREIASEGGEATLCRAAFVEGLRDDQTEGLFHAARDADYAALADDIRKLTKALPSRVAKDDARRTTLEAEIARMRKRLTEIVAVDFFGASGRESAQSALAAIEKRMAMGNKAPADGGATDKRARREDYRGRTWVTRKNVHVDRIACAWLVRRFVDEEAKFKFVPGQGYRKKDGELTFDMFEGDFTHEGDRCSFETILERFGIRDTGLGPLAEIIHDIDVKDGKFGRPEAPGIASLIAGISVSERDDEKRIELGGRMFDALLELHRRKRP